jgi:hypothetical protein
VPGQGHVFIDSDFSQIELVVLGYVLQHQLRLPSVTARLVNSGQDVHRVIAGTMLGKPPEAVTKEERNSVKPVSFSRPGGVGVNGLRKVAKNGYPISQVGLRASVSLTPRAHRIVQRAEVRNTALSSCHGLRRAGHIDQRTHWQAGPQQVACPTWRGPGVVTAVAAPSSGGEPTAHAASQELDPGRRSAGRVRARGK